MVKPCHIVHRTLCKRCTIARAQALEGLVVKCECLSTLMLEVCFIHQTSRVKAIVLDTHIQVAREPHCMCIVQYLV